MADHQRDAAGTSSHSPFWSLPARLAKWALGALPAVAVLLVVGAVAFSVIAGLFGDILPHGISRWWAR